MDPADLDALLDRELRQLPVPRAPRALLPRVMAAVARQPSATGWFTWPLAWRIASLAALVAVVAGGWFLAAAPPAGVGTVARTAGDTATVVRVLWDVLLEPMATYMFVLAISLTLACGAAWAALEFALGGASHR